MHERRGEAEPSEPFLCRIGLQNPAVCGMWGPPDEAFAFHVGHEQVRRLGGDAHGSGQVGGRQAGLMVQVYRRDARVLGGSRPPSGTAAPAVSPSLASVIWAEQAATKCGAANCSPDCLGSACPKPFIESDSHVGKLLEIPRRVRT